MQGPTRQVERLRGPSGGPLQKASWETSSKTARGESIVYVGCAEPGGRNLGVHARDLHAFHFVFFVVGGERLAFNSNQKTTVNLGSGKLRNISPFSKDGGDKRKKKKNQ